LYITLLWYLCYTTIAASQTWVKSGDPIPLRASAWVVNDDEIFHIVAAEREVPNGEAHNNGDEHAPVERHDGEHEEVAQAGVDPEQGRYRHPRRPAPPGSEDRCEERRPRRVGAGWRRDGGELGAAAPCGELYADPEGLEALVEGGGEEQREEGEEVAGPRGRAPAVEENRGRLAPVEGHVHHGGGPGEGERRHDDGGESVPEAGERR
jgi:hypothetical protein